MVPIPESIYFPSLEKWLAGDQLLISWKTAFSAILRADKSETEDVSTIEQFLSHPDVLELLSHPFNAFCPPSQERKAAFETKTSAINVTPSSSARYDIKEIKDDALWLSKEAAIDEVSALRLVVVECQSRTCAQLVDRFSSEELAGIQDAAGRNQSVLPVDLLSLGDDAKTVQAAFDTKNSRQLRILRTYLCERRSLLDCVKTLLQGFLYQRSDGYGSRQGKEPEQLSSRLVKIGEGLARVTARESEAFLLECIASIDANIRRINEGSGWYKEEGSREDVEIEWINNQISEITITMEIIFQSLDTSNFIASSRLVLAWVHMVTENGFFEAFTTDVPSTRTLLLSLQSITAMISLSVLSVGPCLVYIDNPGEKIPSADAPQDAPYILNTMTLPAIHRRVMDISENLPLGAGPMVFGWSIILQRIRLRVDWTAETAQVHSEEYVHFDGRSSGASQVASPPDPYGNAMAAIKDGPVEDPIQYLALTAVNDCKVFEVLSDLALRFGDSSHARFSDVIGAKMRIVILDLIQCSTIVGYIPELVSATLSALTGGQNYWGFVDGRRPLPNGDPLAMFLNDEELVTNILISARARYPYESLPFLKIIRALAACTTCYAGDGLKSVIDFVESVPSFTFILPDVFSAYETTQEEDNNNSIRLIRPVQLFDARARSFNGLLNQSTVQKFDEDFVMPVGTYGRMVSESNPKVAYWFHDYSGFKYFGALLETFLGAGERLDATTGDIADRDSVAEIVGFLATLLVSITKTSGGGGSSKDEALRILEIASSGLGRNRDITTVIFDIFEEELHKQSTSFGSEVPLEVLISCTQFIHALVPIAPGLIWPVVGRSGLLELNRGGGKLSSIVESVELASGRYEFLYSCTRLFEALVEDFVENAVPRKARGKTLTRFGDTPATGVVDQVLSKILLSFTRYLVDVFESSCTWKFVDQDDCRRLSMTISKTFDNILRYAYGLEVPIPPLKTSESITILQKSKPPSKKQGIPTKILLALDSAASHIIESFLSTSTGTLRFQPFLRAFYDGFTTPDTTLFFNESRLCAAQACTVLSFSATLLRASNLLERPASQLESQLFKVSPLIARLYAVDDAYRIPIVALFEALIVSASNNTAEPPSLLGHVGTRTSKNFLRVLSDLDRPLSRDENFLSITHFTSTVISSRQQWFANYLLTGKSSRGLFNPSGKDEKLLDKPLLDTTLDSLSAINDLPKRKAIAMLEFVALAQNHWPWATYNSEKHEVFIRLISDFVGTLKPLPNADSELDACYQTRIAAYIAEILAMHLFHSRQTGKSSLVKDHIPNIDYFVRYAVDNPAYRNSLHENLTKNLENRYIGFKILDLQKTGLETRELGQDYFYDLPLANKMLSFDPIWGKPKGFGNELATANVNLSLVDAQIALLRNWKFLAAELSYSIKTEASLQSALLKVASDCLKHNRKRTKEGKVFKKLAQTRAELALVLIQRLVESNSSVSGMSKVLGIVWKTIRESELTFEVALGSGEASYYRTLLKVLFLGLRVLSETQAPLQNPEIDFRVSTRLAAQADIIPTILDVLEKVVAMGLRDLAAFIHEKPNESVPADVALITAILQACLQVPGIELSYSRTIAIIDDSKSVRVATTLFSWSHDLAIEGDPIYGELSILFLLELSSVPAIAEQLAIDGVLGQIGSAAISSHLKKTIVSPFADTAGYQRCYSIWVRGILPLVLNILDAVGAAIAPEVAVFLLQFPNLLEQALKAFEAPEISRTVIKNETKYITLSICSEVHTTALIMFILDGYRQSATGLQIPDIEIWKAAAVLESAEVWLGSRNVLRERILPMGERDVALFKKKIEGKGVANKLEEKVIGELLGIRDVLGGDP